jgi:hypothetical protein
MGKALAVAWSNRESHDATDVVSEDRARSESGRAAEGLNAYAERRTYKITASQPPGRRRREAFYQAIIMRMIIVMIDNM